MRNQQVSLAANGNSAWLSHDYYQTPFNTTIAGFVSSGASLTWAVQFTPDDISTGASVAQRAVFISQSTTVITVTDNGPPGNGNTHGLLVGDYVRIINSGLPNVDGEYAVATFVSATQYTLTSAFSQTVSGNAFVASGRVFTHSVLTGQTARNISNYAFPVRGSRLVVSSYVSGTATLEVYQGGMST